jgi:uncharacterized membrane protein YebE (DUF533 family)
MTQSDVQTRAVAWIYSEMFGFKKAPPLSDPEVVRNMARALVAAAGGDGDLSSAERTWITGYLAAKGYPADALAEVDAAVAPPHEVSALMELGILKKSGRILVYDAIRAASADGYSPREQAAVRGVASALGIADAEVAAIEQLVADEHALKARRIATLMPDGHPNL